MADWDPDTYLSQQHPDVQVIPWDLPEPLQGCVSHKRRTIWLSSSLDPVARRCTLAYEIAELEQGPAPEDPCLARSRQRAAEEWAALMLIPSELFVSAWEHCLDLSELAARCRVDVRTFRTRIRAASDSDQDAAMEAIGRTRLSAF